MPFETNKLIRRAYKKGECRVFIVYGPLGIGKSTYACKVLAELYGEKGEKNWDAVKERIVFTPRQFVEKCEYMLANTIRDKSLIWDDAGLALLALEFQNPWIRAVIKYLNVMRTNLASLILTTPLPTWIIKKIRGFPQCVTIKIIRERNDEIRPARHRLAKAYRFWISPDMKKSGVTGIYEDHFTALMPNDFFYNFYKPLRESYARNAIQDMRTQLKNIITADEEQ